MALKYSVKKKAIETTSYYEGAGYPALTGIYMIKNNVTNKVYIGQSYNIRRRLVSGHIRKLSSNTHDNVHLQSSWNKYGSDNFTFSIIETCAKEDLSNREQYWINYYNSTNSNLGYNNSPGGDGGSLPGERHPSYGKKRTEESKLKMSIARQGVAPWNKDKTNVYTEEQLNKMSNGRKGKGGRPGSKMPDEVKEKLRIANTGRVASEKTRNKLSNALKGRVITEEHRRKLSEANKGQVPWCAGKKLPPMSEDMKQHISSKLKGRKLTEEHKKNISKSHVGMRGKSHSEEARIKMSQASKGKHVGSNSASWKPLSEDMKKDYINGITRKEFLAKYNVSFRMWDKLKKEVIPNA